jgi:hypothetical protein
MAEERTEAETGKEKGIFSEAVPLRKGYLWQKEGENR